MERKHYQVVVVGGGHAGVEAAWAAANALGEPGSVALVTLDPAKIGVMSCNPAIGGLAKGQLVREVDAMNGLMGLAADASGINFKVLNTSKGPAVHGPRCQADKHAYADAVRAMIEARDEIDVVHGAVEDFEAGAAGITGVVVRTPAGIATLVTKAAVVTTGTFMRGLMHTGEQQTPGGRAGEDAANPISAALRRFGFELGRLKTGTPPRLKRGSIDWESLEPQLGDEPPQAFSELSAGGWNVGGLALDRFPLIEQVDCRRTETTPEAHELIRGNLHRAPIFSGQIESAGPRYCPSIEDKVSRFADRESHGVFLEPESHRSDWVYCNGISTSLPKDVQDVIVRTMPGCEQAEILQYGYAVEYDTVLPHQIFATGMSKKVDGLFLAGQINGTSGYEEAAAQGLIAGLNAARFVAHQGEVTLGRDEAYIGVLMDDLVTKTPVEPYRMFTSRAEHRLVLRSDNAPERLTVKADALGLLGGPMGEKRRAAFAERTRQRERLESLIDATKVEGDELSVVMRRPGFAAGRLGELFADEGFGRVVLESVLSERRYAAYIRRQEADIKRQLRLEQRKIPDRIVYATVQGLRGEALAALDKFRPATFGQAGRLEGVTPADLSLIDVAMRKYAAAHRDSPPRAERKP